MEDRTLLRSQRNDIFQAIQKVGLTPSDFTFTEVKSQFTDSTVSRFTYNHEPFYFIFDNYMDRDDQFSWDCFACPHFDRRKPYECVRYTWVEILSEATTWLSVVQREVTAPDLWLSLAQEKELTKAAAEESEENLPFSDSEKKRIAQGLHEIKQHILLSQKLSKDHQEFVSARLTHLEEAASRMGKKDWITLAVGTLTNIVIGVVLDSNAARELFRIAGTALQWLFKHGVPLLP